MSSDPTSPPPSWLHEEALKAVDGLIFQGNITEFREKMAEISKQSCTVQQIAMILKGFQVNHGKFTRIGKCSDPVPHDQLPNVWGTIVSLFIGNIECYVAVSFNMDKEIVDFQLGRLPVYHTPAYIKEKAFVTETLQEDPLFILSKPATVTGKYPTAILLHGMLSSDIDGRIGFCYPHRDLTFLSCAKIGLVRGVHSKELTPSSRPIEMMATTAITHILQKEETSNIFFIIHGPASMALPSLLKKFEGVVSGVVLINPLWEQKTPVNDTLQVSQIPKDVPILALFGGMNQMPMSKEQYEHWRRASSSLRVETVFYDRCDFFMYECERVPGPMTYRSLEFHMSDVPLRKIAQWIRDIDSKTTH